VFGFTRVAWLAFLDLKVAVQRETTHLARPSNPIPLSLPVLGYVQWI